MSFASLLRLASFFLLVCALTGCAQNPWSPALKITPGPLSTHKKKASDYTCDDKVARTFILLHGIYGDSTDPPIGNSTFGHLDGFLASEFPNSSISLVDYWSSRFLPNFQRLADLGKRFTKELLEAAKANANGEIIIIAHSQGGLIARSAILSLLDDGNTELLARIKLIMIGTPNYASTYAAYNNLIVNTIFSPATYALALLQPFEYAFTDQVRAYVYNRQAFDMASSLSFSADGDPLSPYLKDILLRWGKAFPNGPNSAPETHMIVGVKDLFDELAMSDGIVHSTTALFAGVPSDHIHHVAYRHFGGEAYVSEKTDGSNHKTYQAIRSIACNKISTGAQSIRTEGKRSQKFEHGLSPYHDLPVSWITFVRDTAKKDSTSSTPTTEQSVLLPSVSIRSVKIDKAAYGASLQDKMRQGYERAPSDLENDLLLTLALFPIKVLVFSLEVVQSIFMDSAISLEESEWLKKERPKEERSKTVSAGSEWALIHEPFLIHEDTVRVTVSLREDQPSPRSFFGMTTSGTQSHSTTFQFVLSTNQSDPSCVLNVPIDFKNDNNTSDSRLHVPSNSVSFVHISASSSSIKIARAGGCPDIGETGSKTDHN